MAIFDKFANGAATTITQSIDNVTNPVSFTVLSPAGFPNSPFRVVVDTEIMLITGGFGTGTWTAKRAQEGTTIASHLSAAPITHIVTQYDLNSFLPTYNVLNFGVVGDGTTDDTAAIQSAITAASATGGAVYFPANDKAYIVAGTISLDSTNDVTLSGTHGSILQYTGTAGPMISLNNANRVSIEDLFLKASNTGFTGTLVSNTTTASNRIAVRRCYVTLPNASGTLLNLSGNGINIEGNFLSGGTSSTAIALANNSSSIFIKGNNIVTHSVGLALGTGIVGLNYGSNYLSAVSTAEYTGGPANSSLLVIGSGLINVGSATFQGATTTQGTATFQNTTVFQKDRRISTQSVVYATSITPDPTLGELIIVGTLTGNITINAVAAPATGQQMAFRFTQDATGGRTITWNAAYKTNWQPYGTANAVNNIAFVYDGTNWQPLPESPSMDSSGATQVTGNLSVNGTSLFAATQVLGPLTTGQDRRISTQSPVFAASFTPNPVSGEYVTIGALTANITINNVGSPVTGQVMTLVFLQDATGGRTVTWGAAYLTAWQPAQAPNARSEISFVYNGTNWIPFAGMVAVDQNSNTRITSNYRFGAYQSTAQTAIASATFTKLSFQTKEYDPNTNFDATTNFRYTAPVVGYYLVGGSVTSNTSQRTALSIYKNGTEIYRLIDLGGGLAAGGSHAISLIAGDYVELWAMQVGAAWNTVNGQVFTNFWGYYVGN